MARIQVLDEITHDPSGDWQLCFQKAIWVYDQADASIGKRPGETEPGYRFIYRRQDRSLQAARGQARIGSIDDAIALLEEAKRKGWK